MSNPKDEQKDSTGSALDRRTVILGALAVGGASMFAGSATAQTAPPPAEREWARALARTIVIQIPEALRQTPDIQLSATQVAELQRAFENTLLTNMGCTTTL